MDIPRPDTPAKRCGVVLVLLMLCAGLSVPVVSAFESPTDVEVDGSSTNGEFSNAQKLDGLDISNNKLILGGGATTITDSFENGDGSWTIYGDGGGSLYTAGGYNSDTSLEYFPGSNDFDNMILQEDFHDTTNSGSVQMRAWIRAYDSGTRPKPGILLVDQDTGDYWRVSMAQNGAFKLGFRDNGNFQWVTGPRYANGYDDGWWYELHIRYDQNQDKVFANVYTPSGNRVTHFESTDMAFNPDSYALTGTGNGDSFMDFDGVRMTTPKQTSFDYESEMYDVDRPTEADVTIDTLEGGEATISVRDGNGNVLGSETATSPGTYTLRLDETAQVGSQAYVKVKGEDTGSIGDLDFTMSEDSVFFEDQIPDIYYNYPTGADGTIYTNTPVLSANVSDADFSTVQGDSVTAEWYVNNQLVHQDTGITSNQEITYEPAALPEGTNEWRVRLVDKWGGEHTTANAQFTVDHHAPDISNPSPDGITTPYSAETLSVDVDDDDFGKDGDELTVGWYVDGQLVHEDTGITSAGTVEYTTAELDEGQHNWYVKVGDSWGDTVTSDTYNYTIQHAAPEISNPSIDGVTRYENNTLAVDVSDDDFQADGDNVKVGIYIDGAKMKETTITSDQRVSYQVTDRPDGNYTWSVKAADDYGYLTESRNYTLNIQHDKPAVGNPSLDGLTRYENNTLAVDVSDYDFALDGDTVDVGLYVEGGLVYEETISSNQTVSYDAGPYKDGNYNWSAQAVDDYGHKTETQNWTLNIQHAAPQADNSSANFKNGELTRYEQNTLEIDVSDGDFPIDGDTVGVVWYLDGQPAHIDTIESNQTVQYETPPLADSKHNWSVELIGDYGHTARSDTFNYTIDHARPVFDNSTMSPSGLIDTQKPTFTIDMTDADFPRDEDTVDVGLWVNESTDDEPELEGVETMYQNGTVDIVPQSPISGNSTYFFQAVDDYGYVQNSSKVEIEAPNSLFIHSELAPYDRVRDKVTVSVVSGSNETVDRSVTADGTVEFGQLPAGEDYVFSLQTENHYQRGVYVDDLYARSTIFMLNASEPAYSTTVTFADRTGDFQENPIMNIQTVINTSKVGPMPNNGPQWVTIGGDRLGVTGRYTTALRDGGRYRFRVRSQSGEIRTLGYYTAKEPATVNLEIGRVEYPERTESAYTWKASLNQTDAGPAATFGYQDPTNDTTKVTVKVVDRETGEIMGQDTYRGQSLNEVVYTLPVNQSVYENRDLKIVWNATRGGDTIGGSKLVGNLQDAVDNPPLDNKWLVVIFAGFVFIFAFAGGAFLGVPYVFMILGGFGFIAALLGIAPTALGGGVSVLLFGVGALIQRKKVKSVQPQ